MNIIKLAFEQTKANYNYISNISKTMKSMFHNIDQADEIGTAAFIDFLTHRATRSIEWQYRVKMISGAARIILSDLESDELRKQLDAARCRGGFYHIDADLNVRWVPSSKEGVIGRSLRPMKNIGAVSLALNLMSLQDRMEVIERKLEQPTHASLEELASLLKS